MLSEPRYLNCTNNIGIKALQSSSVYYNEPVRAGRLPFDAFEKNTPKESLKKLYSDLSPISTFGFSNIAEACQHPPPACLSLAFPAHHRRKLHGLPPARRAQLRDVHEARVVGNFRAGRADGELLHDVELLGDVHAREEGLGVQLQPLLAEDRRAILGDDRAVEFVLVDGVRPRESAGVSDGGMSPHGLVDVRQIDLGRPGDQRVQGFGIHLDLADRGFLKRHGPVRDLCDETCGRHRGN
mmetsp:Transcript_12282/g.30983  ORF Transcript_12282/g.30983 Transcript_12282/m.30983 type:complete len:240 (+) Transcript_12282:91-810(+)